MPKESLKADVTGAVVSIGVAVGDRVKTGDTILVLESMKMEIPVEAPRGGIICELLVREGDSVEEAQTVAVLET